MTPLYTIIKSLQSTSGSNAKTALLEQHKDNELLKEFMRITYDPAINFWQTKVPKSADWDTAGTSGMNIEWLAMLVDNLANRKVTGAQARIYLGWYNHVMNTEHRELLKLIIDRSVGAGVGDTMVLKTWPNLFFVPAYMRCSLVSEKTLKPFQTGAMFVIQKKADGQYCSLYTSGKAYTRKGNTYPKWLVDRLLTGHKSNWKQVLLGEVLVRETITGSVLSRQVGNGLINSILKGADEKDFEGYEFYIECWDMLSEADFEQGYSQDEYLKRFKAMSGVVECEMKNVFVIQTHFINSVEEAYTINNKYLSEGFEGSVIKTLTHKWKDHTSPFNVKLKVAFEVDLEIIGVTEGTGKYVGMMGSVSVKSLEGTIKCDVGTGYDDDDRKYVWEIRDTLLGKVMTVKANDILNNRSKEGKSLFLPVHIEMRLDKTVADNYDECVAQLNAAKGITNINSHK